MSKMNDVVKLEILQNLLKDGSGTVLVNDLVVETGSARRARRAIFVARKNGVRLEPVRVEGRAVQHYMLSPDSITVAQVLANIGATVADQPQSQEEAV